MIECLLVVGAAVIARLPPYAVTKALWIRAPGAVITMADQVLQ